MSERRFLVQPGELDQEEIWLDREEAQHARKVLRLAADAQITLLDGQGRLARAVVLEAGKSGLRCRVLSRQATPPPRPRLALCPGLLKAPAMDLLAVKAAELMADEMRPFTSQYSVPRGPEAGRLERWQRLSRQAIKQCGNPRAPLWHAPAPLEELLAQAPPSAARLFFYEQERGDSLAAHLPALAGAGEIWALLGPEGGFSPQEAERMERAGFTPLGLGQTILRAETAALAVLAVLRLGCPPPQP